MAEIDAKYAKTTEAMLSVAVLGIAYFFVAIFVLSQFGSHLGGWVNAIFLPIPGFGIAVAILRTRRTWLRSDAALEQVRAAYESLDALEADIAEHKKRDRDKRSRKP